ncbi:MAG TPA: serine/threonine-protein kinase [Polyangiaceae bacterium LLY-WYZ-15_(1-7)]|nr:hypothetical protein [Sandaracinus sp.]MBJ73038.1 hypothetical protein [Sandaracinus sp.]HJL00085.1 serine/threonine-protein kinase [Polyangiaceae bacterium LLY-WYZ-15_(1-7)]HJL13328.1 serine/threonine-protein kinase [Polyangiaceae bacterium LLY-WYZ-15_(1-7)]
MPAEVETESVEAYAETISASAHRASFVGAPRRTIRPTESPEAAEREALAWLARFAQAGGEGALELRAAIGAGGMGVVREAWQEELGRVVAAKTLRKDMRDAGQVVRLLREAWITGALEHPNIIPVHALRLDADGAPMVVLKKVEGEPWSALLADAARLPTDAARRDPLDWHLGVLRAVCNALAFAHANGVVHRDVKPENVLIGRFGEVYLADWGIAVAMEGSRGSGRIPAQGEAGALAGTPAYMAPEMVRGAPVDARTDVYLLGATLYELLTGAPPHEGGDLYAMLGSILTREPSPPEDAPAELAELCVRALARAAEDRFPSVDAFAEALDAFREHRVAGRLADEATARLEELLARLRERSTARGEEEAEAADEERADDAIQRAFGACRFGFLSALEVWPESERARAGLARALEAMIGAHLDRDDPRAAAALAAEHPALPDALRGRLDAALEARRKEQALLEAVRREQREMDPRVGRGRRLAFSVMLGSLLAVAPVVGGIRFQLLGVEQAPRETLVWPSVALVACLLAGWRWRRALLATRLNRRAMGTLTFAMALYLLVHAASLRLGISVEAVQVLDIAIAFAITSGLVAFVSRRLWPSALAFLVAFVASAIEPTTRWVLLTVSNWTLLANFVWLWPPFGRGRDGAGEDAEDDEASAPRAG